MESYVWFILQITICSSHVIIRRNVEANPEKPVFLQGGLPSDMLEDNYPPEIARMTYFDAELLDAVSDKVQGNVVVSPASVRSVLGILLQGATGKSASEIQLTLRLPENPDEAKHQIQYVQNGLRNASSQGVSMKTASAIFISKDLKLKENYKNEVMTNYLARAFTVDFKYPQTSAITINNWVNQETNGFIPTIIKYGMLKPDNSLIIVNAIYFKANWLTRFNQKETTIRPFYKTANQIQYTPMMHATNFLKHSYVPSLQAQVVQIPFEDNTHYMVIVLPKRKDGINEVTRDMKHNTLLKILAQQEASDVVLQLPRFTIEFETDIVNCLKDMKTREVFTDKAHLQNIAEGNKKFKVDQILHKAKIEVNEKGAYAAAVTEAGLVPLSTPQQVIFTADHPFLFYVYNSRTGIFLFEGRVNQPEEASKTQYEQANKKTDNKNIAERSKPSLDKKPIPTSTENRAPIDSISPTNTNIPNVVLSDSYQPNVVVTQRSTTLNPNSYNYNYQYPTQQQNVVVQQPQTNSAAAQQNGMVQPPHSIGTYSVPQQNGMAQPAHSTGTHSLHAPAGQQQPNVLQSGNKQVVYSQQIPGTQQIFYSSASSSSSSSTFTSTTETKNSSSTGFYYTRYPTGVSGPYQKTNTTDRAAIRFQLDAE